MSLKTFISSTLALLLSITSVASADDRIDTLLGDIAEYWSPDVGADSSILSDAVAESPENSESVTPAQMLAPQARNFTRTARRPTRTSTSRRNSNLTSVPFMIGDTGAGSCLSFGSLLDVDLGHPTLACSRLNISEANTPLPTDRLYYSYRHFHNATPTRVFQFSQDFNIDRHTIAGERTFFDRMMSIEIRLPIEERLNSQLNTSVINPDTTTGFIPGFFPLFGTGSDTRTELGNVSMIMKALLIERPDFALSAGLGVTLPTARDVTYDVLIDEFVTFSDPFLLARYQIALASAASNETVYLSPFLAWVWKKNEKFFHQGFLQVEVPANDSRFTASGFGFTTFDTSGNGTIEFDGTDDFIDFSTDFPFGNIADLQAQTLLRLNLGWGYVLAENPHADWVQKLTGIFEVHYTTTLNDANINSIPLFIDPASTFTTAGFDTIDVGNVDNRIDIVNMVAGLTANVGNWVVTNGATAPLKRSPDRGFDFEYNLQVQRPF